MPSNRPSIQDIKNLENVIFVCFGRPRGDELPQVASEHDVVVDLIHHHTGRPYEDIDAQLHYMDAEILDD